MPAPRKYDNKSIVDAIWSSWLEGTPPSIRRLAEIADIKSTATAHSIVHRLDQEGVISYTNVLWPIELWIGLRAIAAIRAKRGMPPSIAITIEANNGHKVSTQIKDARSWLYVALSLMDWFAQTAVDKLR